MIGTEGSTTSGPKGQPNQEAPYANGIPYLGVHGNAANSDYVECNTPNAWTRGWHGLGGYGMTQPNTFHPMGAPPTSPRRIQRLRVAALAVDVDTGEERWCRHFGTEIERSAVEVDTDGNLYFTVADALVSLDQDGVERWRTPLTDAMGQPSGGWGVHFTPQGHVASVTASGRVYLMTRDAGTVLVIDIAEELGLWVWKHLVLS